MRWIRVDPIGLPGLAVLASGMLAFLVLLLLANRRRTNERSGARASGSWAGVAIQAAGIAAAGVGRFAVRLDPLSPAALGEALVVAALMATTLWLFFASSLAMGSNWAIVARTRPDHELVTTGPFALVRNPIYVALFLFMVAMALAYGHLRNLVLGVPLYAVGTWLRVSHEERLLRARFSGAYDAYAARVKRFVPGLF